MPLDKWKTRKKPKFFKRKKPKEQLKEIKSKEKLKCGYFIINNYQQSLSSCFQLKGIEGISVSFYVFYCQWPFIFDFLKVEYQDI